MDGYDTSFVDRTFIKYRSTVFYLNLSISNGTVSTKIYDKRDDFDFDIVNNNIYIRFGTKLYR